MLSVLLLSLMANPPPTSLSPVETKAVKTFIDSLAKRRAKDGDAAEEFVGGRRTVRGDVDGDGTADLVVLFTLEQGNTWTQFLGLFGGANKPLASGRVGGKGQRSVELQQVSDGRVELSTKNYGPSDALCCPSVEGRSWFVLRAGALEEVESLITGGATK